MKFLQKLAGAVVLVAMIGAGLAHAEDKVVRIGFQKYGKLVVLKGKGSLEEKLKPLGYTVAWTEFPSGPPLLEAMNVGAIDFGITGETPPIFAQAAGAPLVYVAYDPPAPRGEAILVPKDSPLKSLADLKGKKIALNKGSNVHYLLVKALEKAGINYGDVQLAYLAPADARAAFQRGAVDAWVIWDPYQAAAEESLEARTLADGTNLVPNYQFYFSSRPFLAASPKVVDEIIEALNEADDWAKNNIKAVAEQLSPSVGLPASVIAKSLERESYGIKRIDDDVIASQQRIADTFLALGLLPKAVKVSEAQRKSGS